MARISRTGTTDSTGVASTTVTGTGGGRLKFISRNGGLWSNSYEVYDCIVVDKGTSSEHNDIWVINSYGELNRFETYTTLQTKSTASSFGTSQYRISQTPICIECEVQLISKSSGWIFSIRNSGTIRYGVSGANCGVSDEEWHNVKFVIDGTGFKYYLDGELTLSNTNVYSFNTFQMDTRDGMSINFKNFKVYPVFSAPKHYTPIALSSSASIIQTGESATLSAELTNVLGEKLAQKSVNFIEKSAQVFDGNTGIWSNVGNRFNVSKDDTGTLLTSTGVWAYYQANNGATFSAPLIVEFDVVSFTETPSIRFRNDNANSLYGITETGHHKLIFNEDSIQVIINGVSKQHWIPTSILDLPFTVFFEASDIGETIKFNNFKILKDTIIDTETSNSQGVATTTITSNQTGERQFIASNSSILSETYTILDKP